MRRSMSQGYDRMKHAQKNQNDTRAGLAGEPQSGSKPVGLTRSRSICNLLISL